MLLAHGPSSEEDNALWLEHVGIRPTLPSSYPGGGGRASLCPSSIGSGNMKKDPVAT